MFCLKMLELLIIITKVIKFFCKSHKSLNDLNFKPPNLCINN